MSEQKTEMEDESSSEGSEIVVIGITGNMGSGKTTVSEWLKKAGHVVFSSDETAKSLMQNDAELRGLIVQNFGPDVYLDGVLDRQKLASMVFGASPEHHARLALLNRLVHPRVLEEHQRQIEECSNQGVQLVFIESALIYEVGLEDAFDYIVVVDASEDVRVKRVMQRSALTEAEVRSRMKEQMSAQEKVKNADFILDNSSTPEALNTALSALAPILVLLPPRSPDHHDPEEELE